MSKPLIVVVCVVVVVLAVPFLIRAVQSPGAAPPASSASTQDRVPSAAPAPPPAALSGAPSVVTFDPPNGATNVSPAKTELRVTFNMPMRGGFSWTGGGPSFPPGREGQKPSWTSDKRTCVLPVSLQPNTSYRVGLNSPSHKNFKSESGVPLDPVVYTFSTGAM